MAFILFWGFNIFLTKKLVKSLKLTILLNELSGK
jgi:hypothetical protein